MQASDFYHYSDTLIAVGKTRLIDSNFIFSFIETLHDKINDIINNNFKGPFHIAFLYY